MKVRYLLLVALLVVIFAMLFFGPMFHPMQKFYKHGSFGTKDLIMNWACVQSFLAGKNPYDATQLLSLVERWGFVGNSAPAAWLPPWAVVLLSPVYFLDFPIVVAVWTFFNLGIVCVVTLFLAEVYANIQIKFIYLEIAALVFYPLWELLYLGHIGILLTLGFAGSIWALKKRYPKAAGFFLILLTVKLHVVYLLLAGFFLWIVAAKQWKTLAVFMAAFAFLVLVALFRSPSIFKWWFLSFHDKAADFWSATLVGWTRALLFHFQGFPPKWPMVLIPLFSIAVLCYLSYIKRSCRQPEQLIHIVACGSVFTAPYGWLHDFVVLLVTQIALVCISCNENSTQGVRREIMTCIIIMNLATFVLGQTFLYANNQYFWFPGVLLLLWYRGQLLMNRVVVSKQT